ncbi:MAG: M60 family metallopeptidase [Dysgonamonadaceae bacterium]|jgi:hypothetical protein|nr:M60 family metallopeptidase [Dysgonamonadaceae bacterium]
MKRLTLFFSSLLLTIAMTAQTATETDIDRTNWAVTTQTATNYGYVVDGTTGLPEHMFDDNAATFLSLVKPGKNYGAVPKQPSDFIPSFTVDMQSAQTFDYIKWRHRGGNSYKYLRVYGIDIEISNDGTNFTKINTDIVWIPNIAGYTTSTPEVTDPNTYKIDVPQSTGRYVRIRLVMWSDIYSSRHPDYPGTGSGSGSTMQIAEFGLGKTDLPPGMVKHSVIVSTGEGIENVTPYFARIDNGSEFTAIFRLKTDYENPVVTGGATIEGDKIRIANVTADMNLSISATKEQVNITTPYPSAIEINQINSAEKERMRLCQGHKKYDRQPTGFYVEAGKKVEVNVEILAAADQNVMPVLTVGTLGFNVDGRNTGTSTTLTAGVNTVTNHLGGLIWLSFVNDGNADPKGRARITFTDGSEHVRAPRYIYGVTPHAEFASMMNNYQTPDVLYQSDYIVAAATREAALQFSIDENKDEWMESIHTLLAKEDEISGMDNGDPNPLHHRLKTGEVRFLLTENTSENPHASSAGYTGYPHGSRARYLTKLGTASNNSWMLGHELGHQHQQPAYMINLATESTVNIYSYVTERNIQGAGYNRTSAERWEGAQNTYLKLPFSKRIYDMDSELLQSITGFNRDELRFMVWEQLFLIFSDDFYKNLHRVVREEKVTGGGAEERRSYLIWKASQVSGYDLTEFFNIWGIRVTDAEVKAKLRAKMADAKTKGEILDLADINRTAEELALVTGQARPAWMPLALRGITSSSPEVSTANPLDRTNWTITTSIEGVPDATVGGDNPVNIIDGNTTSAFSFIKPGKTVGNVTGPTGYIPSFTIDMQGEQMFNYVSYLHRNAGNTSAWIRARQISVYGSGDNTVFTPVYEHYVIDYAKNDNEIVIEFPEVSYRYIRVDIEDWDKSSGNTIQVAEFNAGIKSSGEQLPVPPPLKFKVNVTTNDKVITSQAGVHLEDEDSDYTIDFTLAPDANELTVTVDGDTVIPILSDAAVVPEKYSLTVKVTNHLDINIAAKTTTGLKFPDGEQGISIYPNPGKAGQPFTVKSTGKFSDGVVNIYTVSGAKVSEQKINAGFVKQTIDLKGTYIIEVKSGTERYMSKIVVN